MSNENLPKQCTYSIHTNKTNCTNAFEKESIKETKDECLGKRFFYVLYLFLWGGTGDNSGHTMNTRSNLHQRGTSSIPNEPSS